MCPLASTRQSTPWCGQTLAPRSRIKKQKAGAAIANGATGKEIQEAVAISVIGDTWSKILTATAVDMVKQDTNTLMSIGTLKMKPRAPATIN